MKKMKVTLLAAALITMGVANAQEASKVYGGVEFGSVALDNETGNTTSALVRAYGGSASATQDASVSIGRIFGGYTFNENVALEVGYAQSSNFGLSATGRSGGGTNYSISATAKFSGLDYSAVIRPAVATGWNGLFVRVGLTNYKADTSGAAVVGGSTYSATSSESGTGNLLGFGYDADIGNGLKFRGAVTSFTKVAGDSDNKGTMYSVGLLKSF
jgi:outer membrane protein W